ncbi:MAG: FIST N-terminal domain-containing protein, partial [Campylobacterota bacterium]|nr:FIST N-terminal domain-containing protein [Campylobacterota bacterium]
QNLELFIKENHLNINDNILVQVFTSQNDRNYILHLISNILNNLPNAKIIGSTTCGEISNNGSLDNSTVISFSKFSQTTLETKLIKYDKSSFTTGQNFIKMFNNSDDLKLLISFTDGLNTNGEEFLNGITSINDKLVISGGMAGDNSKFEDTFVFTQDEITSKGAVGVALYNKDLNIHTDYSFNWETVGKKHIIEKSVKNRVYQISGMSTVEFYKYYLGDDIGKLLPAIGIEFPLVIKRDGLNIARAVLAKHDDGSLSFAGNIEEGSEVQFGHGDVQMIINKGLENVKEIIEHPIESIFIYSCMARKALLKEDINLEILPLKELAPISGFFTYGEFYHNCKNNNCNNQLLNQTMTVLAISENDKKVEKVTPNIFSHNPEDVDDISLHRTQAFSSLIDKTTKELEELNHNLEERISDEVAKNQEKDAILQVVQTQAQLGEMLEMIIHQWRQPLSAITSTASSTQVYQETGLLTDTLLDKTLDDILSYSSHLNTTIEDFRDLFQIDNSANTISLIKLIEKSLTIITPLIKSESIEVIKEFDSDAKISLPIGLFMQVILNITKNAIDILVEKKVKNPKIKFKTYIKSDYIVIKIMDNGGGIPKDILPKVFDKKFTTKGDTHGTGIGLDMSKTIIETKIGGKIKVHNVKEWAVFNIKIPI